jgi:hypothetical protein
MAHAKARHDGAALGPLWQKLQADKRIPACQVSNYELSFSKIGSES